MWNFPCDLSHMKFHIRFFTCEISHVKSHMLNFTRKTSHVKFHMWYVTCEISQGKISQTNSHVEFVTWESFSNQTVNVVESGRAGQTVVGTTMYEWSWTYDICYGVTLKTFCLRLEGHDCQIEKPCSQKIANVLFQFIRLGQMISPCGLYLRARPCSNWPPKNSYPIIK